MRKDTKAYEERLPLVNRRLVINVLLCVACAVVIFSMIALFQGELGKYMAAQEALSKVALLYVAAAAVFGVWAVGIVYLTIRDRRALWKKIQLERDYRRLKREREIIEKSTTSILSTYRQLTFIDLKNDWMQVVYSLFTPQFQNCSYSDVLRLYADNGAISRDDVGVFTETLSIENLQKVLAKENYLETKFNTVRADGASEACIITVALIDKEDGVPVSAAFSIRSIEDILKEDRVQHDMLVAAAEQAEAASKAKGDFLSRISHDMRTPLNAIHGMTALALMNLDDAEKVRDSLIKIDSSSQHLLDIINEVLDLSKIESGKMVLNEGEFDLQDLVNSVRNMCEPQANKKDIELRFACDVEDTHVVGDKGRLREILLNIVGNAVKFTGPGGTVALGVEELERETLGKRNFVFTVADNGIGMEPEFLDRLFEPFSRAEDAVVRNSEGSGLGMSIALNIARLMGGDITVESAPGKGSCFKINVFLAVRPEDASSSDTFGVSGHSESEQLTDDVAQISDFVESDFGGKRALVVDDVDINAEVACQLLSVVGIESDIAGNGKEALDTILSKHAGHYDIVFMDIQMPIMDGYESTRQIRNAAANGRSDLDDLPIVAMTANAFDDDVRNAKAAGMDGHISKPISLKDLKSTLTEWL